MSTLPFTPLGRVTKPRFQLLFLHAATWLSASVLLAGSPTHSDRESKEVLVGMSTALSGPTSHLGVAVRAGVQAAFDAYNREPHHPQLRLLALDDGYEPSLTGPNMRRLIEKEGVVAILGNVGAPCAVTAVPIANELKTPLIGYVTGGSVLRKSPPDRYVINYRASLAEEAAALVQNILVHTDIQPDEIAFFTQRDSFGDSYFVGGLAQLSKHGFQDFGNIVHARYDRNSAAVESGASEILFSPKRIRAVLMGGAGEPVAAFVKVMRQHGYTGLLGAVSFVDANQLATSLREYGNGLIVTQVVPNTTSDLACAQAFRRDIAHSSPEHAKSHIAFEGYIIGQLFTLAIDHVEGAIDRERIVESLLSLGEFDLGLGRPLYLASDQHQASKHIWPSILRENQAKPMEWTELQSWSKSP